MKERRSMLDSRISMEQREQFEGLGEVQKRQFRNRIRKNTILAVFCILFAAIYEAFSHQVYSAYMIGAFLFPVVLGIVPDIIREKAHRKVSESAFTLQQCGIYTLVIGSIFRGVLDIYGTTNQAGVLYWTVGWGLVIVGGIAECIIKG